MPPACALHAPPPPKDPQASLRGGIHQRKARWPQKPLLAHPSPGGGCRQPAMASNPRVLGANLLKKTLAPGFSSLHLSCPLQAGKGVLCYPQFSLGEPLLLQALEGGTADPVILRPKLCFCIKLSGRKLVLYLHLQSPPEWVSCIEILGSLQTREGKKEDVRQRHGVIFWMHTLHCTPSHHPLSHMLGVNRWSFDPQDG